MNLLKQAGYQGLVFRYLSSAIFWMFCLAVLSMGGLLVDFETRRPWHVYGVAAWVLALFTAGCAIVRIMRVFIAIMRFELGRDS